MAIVNSSLQSSISDEFLGLASEVVRDSQSNEGDFRTAISRAYYSVFLTVRDQLFGPDERWLTKPVRKKLGTRFQTSHKWWPGSHDVVLFALTDISSSGTTKPLILYQQISELKEARTHADYHFTDDNLKDIPYNTWAEYADKMVALASQLLPAARVLPPYP